MPHIVHLPARLAMVDSVLVAMVSRYPFVPEAMSNSPPASPLLAICAGLGSFVTVGVVTAVAVLLADNW